MERIYWSLVLGTSFILLTIEIFFAANFSSLEHQLLELGMFLCLMAIIFGDYILKKIKEK